MKQWSLVAGGLVLGLFSLTAVAAKPHYVGVDGCKNCHKQETASWERSPHAKAFESLLPGKRKASKKKAGLDPEKDYTKETDCVKCHVTGFREEGGFKDIESTPEMKGIGCEQCHGPGSEYKILHDEKPNFQEDEARRKGQTFGAKDEEVCTKCHNKDGAFTEQAGDKYKFDWKKSLEKRDAYHLKAEGKYNFGSFKF